jgi:pilus assembly protein CpaB
MGRWRVAVPIVLALLVAAGASVFLYKWTKRRMAPEVVVEEKVKTVQVVVAKVYVPAGTKLTRETLTLARFLEESLPSGYHTDVGRLVERVVITPLKEKELILESRLAPVSVKLGGISALITPGKRAMAISGGKVMGMAGLIRPGDRVDILMNTKDPETKTETNKIVFENVRVLAAGTQLGPDPEGKPSPVDMYTVELTPEEGERLALASGKGSLRFALRNVTDVETVLTTGATLKETLAYYRPIVPTDRSRLKPIAKPRRVIRTVAPRRGYTVEIIKGLKRSIDEF